MDDLYHYGKLGMKWGHHSVSSSSDHADTQALLKKKPKELSNKELEAVAKRLRLETEINKLAQTPTNKVVAKGKEAVGKLLSNYGSQTASALTAFAAAYTAKIVIEYAKKKVPALNSVPVPATK